MIGETSPLHSKCLAAAAQNLKRLVRFLSQPTTKEPPRTINPSVVLAFSLLYAGKAPPLLKNGFCNRCNPLPRHFPVRGHYQHSSKFLKSVGERGCTGCKMIICFLS